MASALQKPDYATWLACQERKAERIPVLWDATLISAMSGDTLPCHMLDITHRGCRIRMTRVPSVGTHITIIVPAFTNVAGWIAWKARDEAGIDFAHPLPPAVLSEVIRRNECN